VIVQPVSPYAESDGRVTRLYAAPRWVYLDDALVPIEQAVAVEHDPATESYRVSLGKEFIELRPTDPAALKAAITGRQFGLTFGPILDPAKAPAVVNFAVNCTAGVQGTANGWQFKDAGDPVGMFIHDWKSQFAGKCTVTASAITLDLAEAKEQALQAGEAINLDPTVTSNLYGYIPLYDGESFDDARNAHGFVRYNTIEIFGEYRDGEYGVGRGPMKFNTSAYPNPASVRLCVRHSEGAQSPQWIRAMRCSFTMQSGQFDNTVVQYEILNGAVMNLFELTGTTNLWASVIPLERYAATADFDIGLIEETYDRPNVSPPDSAHHFVLDGGAPYLELTFGGASRLPLVGVGT
jgi:hypothetical protein